MKPNDPNPQNEQDHSRKSPPWALILILVVVTLPIVAAYVAYYTGMGVSDDTVNKGILLSPPVHLDALTADADPLAGDEAQPELDRKKWRLLLPVAMPCDTACEQNLYTTRQVHIRLGEKGLRVERFAVNLGGESGRDYLADIQADHPLLKHFSVAEDDWDRWMAATDLPQAVKDNNYYLLVDQEGYAMMYYTTNHHGNELLDDIKRVLRYTPE